MIDFGVNNNVSIFDIEYLNKKNEEEILLHFENECLTSIKTKSAYILDKNKDKFDFIEKFVYDMSKFHLNNRNLNINSNNITVEFWFKTTGTYGIQMHTDGDDNAIQYRFSPSPLISLILCLNNNNNPLMITNINKESYKFKKLKNKDLCFFFPKKLKGIIFDGSYYHSEINIFNNELSNNMRNMLVINIWHNYSPINLQFYNTNKYDKCNFQNNELDIIIKPNLKQKYIFTNNLLNDDFFSDFLYKNKKNCFNILKYYFEKEDIYECTFILGNKKNDDLKLITRLNVNYSYLNYYNDNMYLICNFLSVTQLSKEYIITQNVNNVILTPETQLFSYIITNVVNEIIISLKETLKIDNTKKISIEDIYIKETLSYNNNNVIIASIFMYDDFIINSITNEEIAIQSGSLIIQNNIKYKNKNTTKQMLIEFYIDVYN